MQCDIYHPFQCLADLMTITEKKGRDLRKKEDGRVVGVRGVVPETHVGAPVAHPADAALWVWTWSSRIRRNSN